MRLIGLMPVRNEAWCIGFTLRIALKWCDEVVVFLHSCADDSERIAVEIAKETNRVTVVGDNGDVWDEMRHRQAMLELARSVDISATHIAIVDADEFLTADVVKQIRFFVEPLERGSILELPGYNLRQDGANLLSSLHAGLTMYHSSGIWGNRWFATAFQDSPALHWSGDRFHHREPMGCGWNRWRPIQQGDGGTLHLWGASERRLRAKHALYKITERLRWPQKTSQEINRYYGHATDPNQMREFASVPPAWIEAYANLMQYLDIGAEPWQEQEVRSLLQVHGRETFQGLDLLGY